MRVGAMSAAERWLAWSAWLQPDDYNPDLMKADCQRQLWQVDGWILSLEQAKRKGAPAERIGVETRLGRILKGEVDKGAEMEIEELTRQGPRRRASWRRSCAVISRRTTSERRAWSLKPGRPRPRTTCTRSIRGRSTTGRWGTSPGRSRGWRRPWPKSRVTSRLAPSWPNCSRNGCGPTYPSTIRRAGGPLRGKRDLTHRPGEDLAASRSARRGPNRACALGFAD